MTPLEIISRLCEITEELSGIVKKQQEMIERSKVEEGVKEELRNMVNEADGKLDVLEYHMRRYCDTDDVGAYRTGVLIMGKSTSRGGFSETKRTANMFSRWIFDTFSRVLTMMS